MFGDDRHRGVFLLQVPVVVANDVGNDHFSGGVTVRVTLGRVPADGREKPMKLALGMVEPAGARPPVGATEDRLVTVVGANPVELGSRQVKCRLPIDLDEWINPPEVTAATGTSLKPALSDGGMEHPAPRHSLE